jgi:hypothetical protein
MAAPRQQPTLFLAGHQRPEGKLGLGPTKALRAPKQAIS